MPVIRLAEKPVIAEVDDSLGIIITLTEDFEGDKKDVLYKTTIGAIAEALKKVGIDRSHFDTVEYKAATGYMHILCEGKDVVEPCYIGKFAEVDENGIIPEKNLPYFNKSHTLFADGKPLYGTQFVDVTDSGEIVIHEDGSGDYLLTVLADGTATAIKVILHIADNLESDDAEKVLSARQGKILGSWIGKISELLTTAKTNLVSALNEIYQSVTSHLANKSNPHGVTKSQVGLGNADNTADANKNVLSATKLTTARKINGVSFDGSADITIEDNTKIPTSQKGVAGGVATLNDSGQIPSAQLPSYVDDTIEGTLATFPKPGESGKIYVDTDTDLTYRWSGSQYVEISKSLALGETSSTAYPGNKGKESAEKIAELQETSAEHTEQISANAEKVKDLGENKADLSGGVVPDAQLPYYNRTQNLYVGETLLFPIVFVDVDDTGAFYLREDGYGDYLLYIPMDGVPRLKYVGKAVTDDVTGVSYKLTVSNGEVDLKQIL